jgi:hypothetical protein
VVGIPDEVVARPGELADPGGSTVSFHRLDARAIDRVDLLGAEVLGPA